MNTQEKIVHAAKSLFVDKGFANTQMKEIATVSGINRRTLYRYFPTKEDLLLYVYKEAMNELHSYLNSVADDVKGDNGFEKFRHYLTEIDIKKMSSFMFFIAQFDSRSINFLSNDKFSQEMKSIEDPKKYRLFDLICEGVGDGSMRNDLSVLEIFMYLSHSFMAMYQRIIMQQFDRDRPDRNAIDYEKLYITMTLDGIKKVVEKDSVL